MNYNPCGAADTESASHASVDEPARFEFVHNELAQEHVCFRRGDTRDAVIAYDFGATRGVMTIGQLCDHLKIDENHPDRRLIGLVPFALNSRRMIRHGDSIPTELTSGSPSWTPPNRSLQDATTGFLRAFAASDPDIREIAIGEQPAQDGALNIASRLVGALPPDLRTQLRNELELDEHALGKHLSAVLLDMARIDAALRVTSTIQRFVGDIARYASEHRETRQGDVARAIARELRPVNLWASERAIRLQTNAQRVEELVTTESYVYTRIWPALRCLYALRLDVEPLLARWAEAGARHNGATLGDLDELLKITRSRFGKFDPSDYDASPTNPSVDPFLAFDF